jgi:type IV fimbrial biogenesis protein FimT
MMTMYQVADRPIRSGRNGFTLLEVVITLALLAVVTLLALPSFVDMIEKRRLSSDAERLLSFIQHAQSVSIKRNEVVTISYTRNSDEDWCIGAVLGAAACDCSVTDPTDTDYCIFDSKPSLIISDTGNYSSLLRSFTGDGALTFDPVRGMSLSSGDDLALDLRSQSEAFRMQLLISDTGLTELCSQDTAHRVPSYNLCN